MSDELSWASAILQLEHVGGDGVVVVDGLEQMLFVVFDVLGHGVQAEALRGTVAEWFQSASETDPQNLLEHAHRRFRGSRGFVIAVASLERRTGRGRCAIVGNIRVSVVGGRATRIVGRAGVIGRPRSEIRVRPFQLEHDQLLVMHTDGVGDPFRQGIPAWLRRPDLQSSADRLIQERGSAHDDAACLLVRRRVAGGSR